MHLLLWNGAIRESTLLGYTLVGSDFVETTFSAMKRPFSAKRPGLIPHMIQALPMITGPSTKRLPVPIGSMVLPYMVTWIPSIYTSHDSIYTSTMDPMG